MSEIQSHPDRTLAQHLAEIRAAAAGILRRHGTKLTAACPELVPWFADAVALHDAGKASPQFQTYIVAPEKYKGDKRRKAHTPLSTLFAVHHGNAVGWAWTRTLAVAQIAAGHHSEFRDLECLEDMLVDFDEILGEQIPGIDHDALHRAVGALLPRFEGVDILDAVDSASDLLKFDYREKLDALPLVDAVRYRLVVQLVFSVLLEADKAFLAVPSADRDRYLAARAAVLPPVRVTEFVAGKPSAVVNTLRADARSVVQDGMARTAGRVLTMTLPTGTGKTLLAATWALETRERLRQENGTSPPVLIVLPFLTVIEQTAKEYAELFPGASDAGVIANYHSLSDRTFDRDLEDESQDFFLDTWQSDIVITTFDQFLYALLSAKAKHLMRFHHLADAIVVLDEVQAFPCVLWEPLRHALGELTQLGSTHILAMSATRPGFLPDAAELIDRPEAFFARMCRYRILLRHRTPMTLLTFIDECRSRMTDKWPGRRVMLTLNTRRSARRVRDALAGEAAADGFRVEFLTADVTPADRLAAVNRIKAAGAGESWLIVSTQCVEAGVDIDLDLVIRDFGPLDSLIQIAGRCNRNGRLERGIVEIVNVADDEREGERTFASQVYDKTILDATHAALGEQDFLDEEGVFPVSRAYFQLLKVRKDTGEKAVEDWARWREMDHKVREMLRGPNRPQYTFVVVERDTRLPEALKEAVAVEGRWERRRKLRSLAGQIARVSVSIYVRGDLDPSAHADPFPPTAQGDDVWFWLLHPGRYTPERGIDLGAETVDAIWGTIF